MDLNFSCPNCKQQLAVDASGAGSEITCPSCNQALTVPEPDIQIVRAHNPIASSAGAKEDRHFSVPVHDHPTEFLIEKPLQPLDAVVKDGDKRLRIRSIKRTDCVEVGRDRFDEVVTEFLGKVGEANIVSINTLSYSHLDIGSQKLLTDYGVMIVYKG